MTDQPITEPRPKTVATVLRRTAFGVALLVACAAGAGATAIVQRGHHPVLVALAPSPIATMTDWSQVAVKGRVAEIFGNKFILSDDSGRALIETGPDGASVPLVVRSDTVTVQGRFEHGWVHATAIQYGDGRTVVLGPPGPPRPWPQHPPLP